MPPVYLKAGFSQEKPVTLLKISGLRLFRRIGQGAGIHHRRSIDEFNHPFGDDGFSSL
jgi:hypothetical protein